MENRAVEVSVDGTVQGVGFRPFVYRTAVEHDLTGRVKNVGSAGVEIVAEGESDDIEAFLDRLETTPPPLASVERVRIADTRPNGFEAFEIVSSEAEGEGAGIIPPDTGLCEECLEDIRDPESRFYQYWATSCVNCGPRYTVVESVPYDREQTTMVAFPMCQDCEGEYTDPGDRRYHAQTIACPDCGPDVAFYTADKDREGSGLSSIETAASRLADGDILGIKGLGGFHLACRATDPEVVAELRERSGRPAKPFALMAPDLASARSFATVDSSAAAVLSDIRRPIVVLPKASQTPWLAEIAPGLHTVGVMLPYTGLHHLLFQHLEGPLVMTSANRPGEPMATTIEALWNDLDAIIDGALGHERRVAARTDDSVVRFAAGSQRLLRRSRGWVPEPIDRPPAHRDAPPVLAVGGTFDTTVALAANDRILLSQHVGDVDGPDGMAFFRETIERLRTLTGIDPEVVACDTHPGYPTTEEAERLAAGGRRGPIQVQHHHAHAAGLLAEHERDHAIVITADGTGHGPDGSIWGGEVLDARLGGFERVGGLDTFELPGGEAAARKPARILASLLSESEDIDRLLQRRGAAGSQAEAAIIRSQVAEGVNTVSTTSAGRFLDAMSALLDAGTQRRYQGEPAMRLEALAAGADPLEYTVPFTTRDGTTVLDVRTVAREMQAFRGGEPPSRIAATVQAALAEGLSSLAIEAAQAAGVDAVGFTGGVAYNAAITERLREEVNGSGLEFLEPTVIPAGDGGLAFGQAVVASERMLDESAG